MSRHQREFKPIIPHKITRLPGGGIYSDLYQDIFYQPDCGQSESAHVFCQGNDLNKRFAELKDKTNPVFVIGEIGFGTGLNFLNVMRLWGTHAPQKARLHYLSAEKHPLTKTDLSYALSQFDDLSEEANQLIDKYPVLTPGWHRIHFRNITLTLMLDDCVQALVDLLPTNHVTLARTIKPFAVDAWFLDGFSPKQNQACWREQLFSGISAVTKQGATLSTFSVAREVKDNLQQHGFDIQKSKGFGKKREMLTATFKGMNEKEIFNKLPASEYHTPWQQHATNNAKRKSVMVLGAGLAGAGIAFQLAERGYQVTVIDKGGDIASGASGNPAGILDVKFSHAHAPLSDFNLAAFLYATQFYKRLGFTSNQGLLRLAYTEKERLYQNKLQTLISAYPELITALSKDTLKEVSGVAVDTTGILIKQAGMLSPREICKRLLDHPNISLHLNELVDLIEYDKSQWHTLHFSVDLLVLANSLGIHHFSQTRTLPISPYPGELYASKPTHQSAHLKLPISGDGYLTPLLNGEHLIGMGKTPSSILGFELKALRIMNKALRAKTPDYLPLIGPVPKIDAMEKTYRLFKKDANYWIPTAGQYYPNLFILAGLGSHGLTSMPLASEILASLIHQEPPPVSRQTYLHLSASRFLIKDIKSS